MYGGYIGNWGDVLIIEGVVCRFKVLKVSYLWFFYLSMVIISLLFIV